jgi:hypothetical protein
MYINWFPGKAIARLPYPFQPPAILYRNILHLMDRSNYKGSHADEQRELSIGVEYVYGARVEGEIAEFGTMSGRTAQIIARAMSKYGRRKANQKQLHLFDSFQGLPKAESEIDKHAPDVKSGIWAEGTCDGISKEQLLRLCARSLPKDKIAIYAGWFKDTLPQVPHNTKFSMLHLDCDLYQSTYEVLNYCFANRVIQEGTVLFFHDWNANRASRTFGERKAWADIVEQFSIAYSHWGYYGWGGARVIVHSYNNTV